MTILKDSGDRRRFKTGAVRDKSTGKGRCDILPLVQVAEFLGPEPDQVLLLIEEFQRPGDLNALKEAISLIMDDYFDDAYDAVLQLAVHYEDGAIKYDDRNWELGQELHVFLDCAIRHYLKMLRGDEDEPHARACLWNLFGAWWTLVNHPELNDLPFAKIMSCGNCRYAPLSSEDIPCCCCVRHTRWETPIEIPSKNCGNCLHSDLDEDAYPCNSCSGTNADAPHRWEPAVSILRGQPSNWEGR